MFLLDAMTPGAPRDLILSASDLVAAGECEFGLLRALDEKLGRLPKADHPIDPMLQRAGELGGVHEARVLNSLVEQYGDWNPLTGSGVYRLTHDRARSREGYAAQHGETLQALASGADVVFQAAFFDGQFVGYADFLVKQDDGRYAVWDTKLARHAKTSALLQLAAYGDQLVAAGFEPAPEVVLVLGDLVRSTHDLASLLPVFRERLARLRELTAGHRAAPGPVVWGQAGVAACGRCDYCAEQVETHRDLLLVGRMRLSRRHKLMEAGITTIDDLAAMPESEATGPLARWRDQARMQLGLETVDGSRTVTTDGMQRTVSFKVLPDHDLASIPAPSQGDVFFDFEGDPLWQDPATGSWGLEYLFGVVETPTGDAAPPFRPFWAHSRAEERQAFLGFLTYVEARRQTWPDLHVYHYAAYEKTALRNLSVRHGVGEDIVDDWLKSGVLVDLYAVVRTSLRISEPSYSIKKLEPLYMGDDLRSGDVKDAGASVVAFAALCTAREAGQHRQAAGIQESIADYNRYDCISTLRLRDWLLGLRTSTPPGHAKPVGPSGAVEVPAQPPTEEELRLSEFLDSLPPGHELTADDQAVAMVAAATGYHRREDKQFWWGHFDRLESPVEDWEDVRNVFIVESGEVLTTWAPPTPRSNDARTIRLRGRLSEGSDFKEDSTWFRVYSPPAPDGSVSPTSTTGRGAIPRTTLLRVVEDDTATVLEIEERRPRKVSPYDQFPTALTPDEPYNTGPLRNALADLAAEVGRALPSLPRHPGLEILRRTTPQLNGRDHLPAVATGENGLPDYVSAITEAVAALDHSYLAVQGPPGTGKTHVGAHVIARLIERGWKVGVVGQSHAVVEKLLTECIDTAGVDPKRVGKKTDPDRDVAWAITDDKYLPGLLNRPGGCLIGGTAWTMTGRNVPPRSLDLLVIEEAGQYSLANTLAVARASKRLLLLGDPRQLPQVTQGSHPQPVDESALGWLSHGHATLPDDLGYFLADSWRMHPNLCAAVSTLSYNGKLHSAPAAGRRSLDGAPAGVETVLVQHTGNTTSSDEEADEVVRQAERHLGLAWTPRPDAHPQPLRPEDLLVVAPYNAQVNLIRDRLDDAGLTDVRVGTVDKFQGQEAPVVLVSMACSAAAEAPRGMEFLLNRNRINVAVSRGQWRAVIIRSANLTDHLPATPAALEDLGAFIGLCSPPVSPTA